MWYDAHNHLHDPRLAPHLPSFLATLDASGIQAMVVNGTSENDWDHVLSLARRSPRIIPSIGLHPWKVPTRSPQWEATLQILLDAHPCAIGEIGLDKWKPDLPYHDQEEVFLFQMKLAADRNLPASIHVLKAWDRLPPLLRESGVPACGFLLHSWGGPPEQLPLLLDLGAHVSFPGYFARPGKEKRRLAFAKVPHHRLLVETDAPDQPLPDPLVLHPLDHRLNHPANLPAVYAALAETLNLPLPALAGLIEQNFHRLFGSLIHRAQL
ncbi:MAG TPA: TatD family hydrolase [Kiritimatiellia bacterium]|mgnify:CR=1 FL=1|nr:TatD family hydrolase [Kiritimatiellia bacterium]